MALYCGDAQTLSAAIAAGGSGTAISVAVWIKMPLSWVPNAGTNSFCYRQVAATSGYFHCGFIRNESTTVRIWAAMFQSGGSGSSSQVIVNQLLDGKWHHVVYAFGGGWFTFWVDGIRVHRSDSFRSLTYSGTVTSTIGQSDIALGVGTVLPITYADLQVYSRELSKRSEIIAIADGKKLDPSARYCVGAAVTGADLTGNGNDLTTVGTLSGTFTGMPDPPWLAAGMSPARWYRRKRLRGSVAAAGAFTPHGLWFTR